MVAVEVYDSDLVAKSMDAGFASAGVERDEDQSEHGQHEEEEGSSPD